MDNKYGLDFNVMKRKAGSSAGGGSSGPIGGYNPGASSARSQQSQAPARSRPADEPAPAKKEDAVPYAKVVLKDVRFAAGTEGFAFNKVCRAECLLEIKHPTASRKGKLEMFCRYKGEDELVNEWDLHFDETGKSGTDVTLYYGTKYYDGLYDNPQETCEYVLKLSHRDISSTLESAPLKMPAGNSATADLKKGHYDDKAVAKYSSRTKGGAGYVAGTAVYDLQTKLVAVGLTEIGTPDGDFGGKTENALTLFQGYAEKGIFAVDGKNADLGDKLAGHTKGVFDEKTRGYLGTVVGKNAKVPVSPLSDADLQITYQGSIPHIAEKAANVLRGIMKVAGVKSVTITSTVRTPEDQARIMYDNIVSQGVAAQKDLYGTNGDLVIDVYSAKKKEGKSKEEIKQAMRDKIVELGSTTVSKHCCDPATMSIFDVAPSSVPDAKKPSFEAAIKASTDLHKYFLPPGDPAYHMEVVL